MKGIFLLIAILSISIMCSFAQSASSVPYVAGAGPLGYGSLLTFDSGGSATSIQESWGLNINGAANKPVKVINTSLMIGYTTNSESITPNNVLVNGNIGIGTTNPQSQMDISGSMQLRNYQNVIGTGSSISFSSYGAISEHPGSRIRNYLINAQGAANSISKLILSSYNGGYNDEMTLYNGNVGINMAAPQYPLDVNGQIHAKGVIVNTTGFPDFVFSYRYKLNSLKEVEAYIKRNHHLSELPSQELAVKDGVDLGEINKKLLQKVEELTLYLIQKDKQLTKQEKKFKKVNERLSALENQVKHN